jgi:hypothetical protein
MMGVEAPETCWATHKRQVINFWNCCILLVDLFESYDDARTCKRQILSNYFISSIINPCIISNICPTDTYKVIKVISRKISGFHGNLLPSWLSVDTETFLLSWLGHQEDHEGTHSFKTSETIHPTTQCHIPEDFHPHNQCSEQLKNHTHLHTPFASTGLLQYLPSYNGLMFRWPCILV